MISRRCLLQVPLLLPVAIGTAQAALPVPTTRQIAFKIFRNGDEVGLHVLRFSGDDAALDVAIEIDIAVKLGPITVYRYHHRGTESWRGGQFAGMRSKTDDDGSDLFFHAERTPSGVVVEGAKTERYIAPEGVLPTTYWNQAMVRDQVLNSQDGRLFNVEVMKRGIDQVPVASGKVEAQHFEMHGDLPLDLWYDDAHQWAYLEFSKRASRITYLKL